MKYGGNIELYLSRTTPSGQVASDGKFVLALHAIDRQSGGHMESWRLIWAGTEAHTFWAMHRTHLQPGTPLEVGYSRLRTIDSKARYAGAEILASVNSLHLPVIAANPHQKHHAQNACGPCRISASSY